MKEAIAQSFIVSLILFFFGILLLLFFGSINYSKAFKAKNRIINIVEKYGTIDNTNSATVESEIEENLANGGYQTIYTGNGYLKCTKYGNTILPSAESEANGRVYEYCVIPHNTERGNYYQVITFMRFEVPLIGGVLEFPVRGETKMDILTK